MLDLFYGDEAGPWRGCAVGFGELRLESFLPSHAQHASRYI